LNRSQLVKAVAAQTALEARVVDQALKGLTDVITAVNSKGEPVAISGFAKFSRVDRKARMGRNPQTGAPVQIKASKRARISALKAYKDAVLTPSLAPKLLAGVWPPAPAAAKKAPARKAPAKKAPAKKAPAKKAPARKAPAKKAPAKKAATRR
jgi:DNA-binding protein HU-beta